MWQVLKWSPYLKLIEVGHNKIDTQKNNGHKNECHDISNSEWAFGFFMEILPHVHGLFDLLNHFFYDDWFWFDTCQQFIGRHLKN